jgi:hypothetical protein
MAGIRVIMYTLASTLNKKCITSMYTLKGKTPYEVLREKLVSK